MATQNNIKLPKSSPKINTYMISEYVTLFLYMPLPKKFYQKPTTEVAKALLGSQLVHQLVNGKIKRGKIVETEAYLGPKDLACHSSRGKPKRTAVMFGPAGHAYIYLIYGIHYMFNVVTEAPGEAVLIRAVEPVSKKKHTNKGSGPGKLTNWMEIDKKFNGWDLTKGTKLWIEKNKVPKFDIIETPRVGVNYAKSWGEKDLRYYIKDNHSVSTS